MVSQHEEDALGSLDLPLAVARDNDVEKLGSENISRHVGELP